jgi:Xaa-Pro aminopeptidase
VNPSLTVAPGGTVPLVDGPDLAGLRARCRQRVFDAMAAHRVDVLVMGRPTEVTYATGTRQLWLAGSRPFGPSAIAVAATGRIHLLGTSDDGVPDEVGFGDLFAMSWNPARVRAAVAALPGIAEARRVATTSGTVGFEAFVHSVAPEAEIVDGAALLDAVRRVKDADEVACVAAATALAADALGAVAAQVAPGVTERELLAGYLGRLGELGVPTPPTEGIVCAWSSGESPVLRRVATDRRLGVGDRVVLDVAANVAAYEGGIGTTVVVGSDGIDLPDEPPPAARCAAEVFDASAAACRPGTTGAEVRHAGTSAGGAMPPDGVLFGVGLGVEPPVVAPGIGDDAVLEAGMVVAVCACVADVDDGGWYEKRLLHVGAGEDGSAAIVGPVAPPPDRRPWQET